MFATHRPEDRDLGSADEVDGLLEPNGSNSDGVWRCPTGTPRA
jgi:hypothetical protein